MADSRLRDGLSLRVRTHGTGSSVYRVCRHPETKRLNGDKGKF